MTENTSWHSYPSIFALGHKVLAELLEDVVIVEEKVDGSQFSFGLINGELKLKSKGVEFTPETPNPMFNKAVETVLAVKDKLAPGYTYRAEYLQKPKHNALAYDRTPVNNLMIFDINWTHEGYLPYETKKEEAERLGFEVVPLLYQGKIGNSNQIREMLDRISVLGGQKVEGVVVKNYHRFGPDKKVLMGKYVSEAFKEVHAKAWGESNPGRQDVLERIIDSLKTPARWNKAIQHLEERGELTQSPKDIGRLIKEVQEDIKKEEMDFIKDKILCWAMPFIMRGVVKGVPEYYKQKLLENQFTNAA